MNSLHELFESTLEEMLSANDAFLDPTDLQVAVTEMIPELAEETADAMLGRIKKSYKATLKANRREQARFENRHIALWKEPLDLLELFIAVSREAGEDCNRRLRNSNPINSGATVEALTRLHAKACQTSSAILILLRFGYADDANARWRSLHEIAVVGHFLRQGGEELAQRYLLHDAIQRYRIACALRDYADRTNEVPLPESDFEGLKAEHDELIARFGKQFGKDYGWAESVLKKKDPKLSDIELFVKSDHWRPYYRLASGNVHPNAHGIYFRLGLRKESDNILLVGPSNFGLADPGHSTAVSLLNITIALLMVDPTLDDFVHSSIVERLADEVGESFLQVHRKIELHPDPANA